MEKAILFLFVIFFVLIGATCSHHRFASGTNKKAKINVIPKPVSMTKETGSFEISTEAKIYVQKGITELQNIGNYLADFINKSGRYHLKVEDYVESRLAKGSILLTTTGADTSLGEEGYLLLVDEEAVTLLANHPAGIFYGVQTFLQLLPPEIMSNKIVSNVRWSAPCVKITDFPRYRWRGMMLDVSRHFFPTPFIKKFIDMLAMYKMNTFHWHLTDDQGWRIEIKRYPRLTEIGSIRKETLLGHSSDWPQKFDGEPYGGFYTQEEIKEIVAYAKDRYVKIIPEIEMPGHSTAALAAYPELACTEGPFQVSSIWGVHKDVYCPSEKTFEFLNNVLAEVIDLFPGTYIHIGGDECPKDRWRESAFCQELMKKEALKDETELQSYFIKRIEKFLNSKNRQLIGWDEILEGGLSPNATVMSWRGMEGGIAAAKEGHDVIMSPTSHCYFDYYQGSPILEPLAIGGYIPLEKVYSFEPTPDSLTAAEAKHILGAQGNVWTEYITTPEYVEYMTLPRLCALAEVIWSPKDQRNWDDFSTRLEYHFKTLDLININYARSVYDVHFSFTIDSIDKKPEITMETEIGSPGIHYTMNGSEPSSNSNPYKKPVKLQNVIIIKAGAFAAGKLLGKISEQRFIFHKATGKKVKFLNADSQEATESEDYILTDGMLGSSNYNDGKWKKFLEDDLIALVDLESLTPINKITTHFLQRINQWIILPEIVEFSISKDGKEFDVVATYHYDKRDEEKGIFIKEFTKKLDNKKVRIVKVYAKNFGVLPEWTEEPGNSASMFIDEIIVE